MTPCSVRKVLRTQLQHLSHCPAILNHGVTRRNHHKMGHGCDPAIGISILVPMYLTMPLRVSHQFDYSFKHVSFRLQYQHNLTLKIVSFDKSPGQNSLPFCKSWPGAGSSKNAKSRPPGLPVDHWTLNRCLDVRLRDVKSDNL